MEIRDIVNNEKIYGIEESFRASKFPMSTNVNECDKNFRDRQIKLANAPAGSGHDCFLKGIVVQFDLSFTNKAWVEAERYHFFDIISSQSTMHCLPKFDLYKSYCEYVDERMIAIMQRLLNNYNSNKTVENRLKLLYSNPCGFILTARITTNYLQLKTIYAQRKNHALPEWRLFCKWIEQLPYSNLITGGKNETGLS